MAVPVVEGGSVSAVHVLVWVDHERARLIELSNGESRLIRLGADDAPGIARPAAGAAPRTAPAELFESVAEAISGAAGVVIAGPGNDRLGLARHLKAHHPDLSRRVIGVEQMGQATDTMLRTYARTYFRLSDRPRPI